jgi:hypothetical protein
MNEFCSDIHDVSNICSSPFFRLLVRSKPFPLVSKIKSSKVLRHNDSETTLTPKRRVHQTRLRQRAMPNMEFLQDSLLNKVTNNCDKTRTKNTHDHILLTFLRFFFLDRFARRFKTSDFFDTRYNSLHEGSARSNAEVTTGSTTSPKAMPTAYELSLSRLYAILKYLDSRT